MSVNRREWLAATAAVLAGGSRSPAHDRAKADWGYCLNTSTIRGQKLSLPDEVDLIAKAGYQAIEPWVNEVDQYVKSGGSLVDLRKRVNDRGLIVADLIGFPEWIVDDDSRRQKGLDEAKRAMDLAKQLGCERIAAPPIGAHQANDALVDLNKVADRYFALAQIGAEQGVTPLVEVWGFSPNIRKLSDAVMIAMQSGHPRAAILPDVYHLHKGGSPFEGVRLLGKSSIGIFHVNDYPATISREKLVDANRVYPGDGAAPWKKLLADLRETGYRGLLSVELFNPEYWKHDPNLVARTALDKLKAVVGTSRS